VEHGRLLAVMAHSNRPGSSSQHAHPCFLQAAARSAAAGADAGELPYEHLRAQLAEKAAEVEVLACRLEAKQAELEVAQEAARAQGQRWGPCCTCDAG
jgi:hypothetical protein